MTNAKILAPRRAFPAAIPLRPRPARGRGADAVFVEPHRPSGDRGRRRSGGSGFSQAGESENGGVAIEAIEAAAPESSSSGVDLPDLSGFDIVAAREGAADGRPASSS